MSLVSPDRRHASLQLSTSQQQSSLDNTPAIEAQRRTLVENQNSNSEADQAVYLNGATEHEGSGSICISHDPMLAQLEVYDVDSMPIDGGQLDLSIIMDDITFMPNVASFNNQNLDINFYDFIFEDEQLHTLPLPYTTSNTDEATMHEEAGQTSHLARNIRAGYAAFTRSPWLWTPAPRDFVLSDGESLTLDEGSVSSALTPRSSSSVPNVPSCGFPTISSAMRDRMYYLVSTMTIYTSRIPDFPSLEVINHVVEYFFVRQTYQVDNWIHVPSMSLSNFIPELGLALVIAGSTVISVPAIWKMGLVLQDVLRVKIGELVRNILLFHAA